MSTNTPTRSATSTRSAIAVIRGSRFLRSATITLLVSGMAVSASVPQLTTFLVTDLGASLPVAGLYYLTNVASPLVGFAMGRLSDRRDDRLTLFRIGAVVGALGWVAMGLTTQIWMPFVISVVFLGVAGAAGAQVYAAARDELSRHPTPADVAVMSTIRMAFSLGWVVGPVVGSVLGGVFGLRVVMFCTAALAAGQLLPMIGVRAPRFCGSVDASDAGGTRTRAARRELAPLLAFSALATLAVSGDTIKFAYLPIYMQTHLGISDGLRGAIIAYQPLLEVALMPLAAMWASRVGAVRVVIVGTGLGALANAAYALSSSAAELFVAQTLMAGMWATIAGLGVTVAQQLYPRGVGVASSTFLSSVVFASTVGGLVGSVSVSALGLPGIFVVPAALCVLALVGMVVLAGRLRLVGVGVPGTSTDPKTSVAPGRVPVNSRSDAFQHPPVQEQS